MAAEATKPKLINFHFFSGVGGAIYAVQDLLHVQASLTRRRQVQ